MEGVKTEYGDWKIEYKEWDDSWEGEKDGRTIKAQTLRLLKESIDKHERHIEKKTFKRIPCLNDQYEEGEITSIAEILGRNIGHNNVYVWFSRKRKEGEGDRRKVRVEYLLRDTPKNRELGTKITTLEKELEARRNELEYFKDEEFLEEE